MKPIHSPADDIYHRIFSLLSSATLISLWIVVLVTLSPGPASAQTSDNYNEQALTLVDLKPLLEDILIEKGAPADASVTLSNPAMQVPGNISLQPDNIQTASWSENTGRFVIRLGSASTDGAPSRALTITGTARTPVTIPVLARDVARGEIINASDVLWQSHTSQLHNLIQSIDDIIGYQARRNLTQGTPLRDNDLARPILIKRGALVTMEFRNGNLTLRHQGQAKASGGFGDIIAVENLASARTIKGVITAPDRVEIVSATHQSSSSNGR